MDTFKDALDYEKSMQPIADHFYKDKMGAVEIVRYNYNDPRGKVMQKKDIDCTIMIHDNQKNIIPINISEKFRREYWGDMWIELYSRYPNTKGWALESDGVDLIAYFIDGIRIGFDKFGEIIDEASVYLVDAKQIKNLAKNIINQFDNDINLKDHLLEDKKYTTKYEFNGKQYDVVFRTSKTIRPGYSYDGVGVCIRWDDLKEMGIKTEYKNRI